MADWNLLLLVVGLVVVALGAVSAFLRRVFISPIMVAFGVGAAISTSGFGWVVIEETERAHTLFEEAVRLTLALGLMETALRIPNRYLREHWRQLLALLVCMMVPMWMMSSVLAGVFLSTGLLTALLLGAILTPTDPVLASSIVSGAFADRHLPAEMRHRISFESGANDGLGLIFVALPIALIEAPAGAALGEWFATTVLWSVVAGTTAGAVIGFAAGALLHWVETRNLIERASYLAYSIALAMIILGAARLLKTDGILAVFAGGLAFSAVLAGSEDAENEFIQETFNQFFFLPVFLVFGLIAPWEAWYALGPGGWTFVIALLLLRRVPAAFLNRPLARPLHDAKSLAFFGWFGPLGIAALFYALHAEKETGNAWYWHVTSLAVFASIVAHGATAPVLTRMYGRNTK